MIVKNQVLRYRQIRTVAKFLRAVTKRRRRKLLQNSCDAAAKSSIVTMKIIGRFMPSDSNIHERTLNQSLEIQYRRGEVMAVLVGREKDL